MYLKAIPNAAVRLLPVAIAGILSQAVVADGHLPAGAEEAKPLCAAPSVNVNNLDIDIPCFTLPDAEGQPQHYRIKLGFVPAATPYWGLTEFAASSCRAHLSACRGAVDLNTLDVSLPGLMFAGVNHHLSLKKTADMTALAWYQPSLMTTDPFMNNLLEVSIPVKQVKFPNGTTKAFDVGIGSGAFHYPQDGANTFYTITDRGPNIPCDDAPDIIGMTDFCKDAQGNPDPSSKIFPVPEFTPSIYRFQLSDMNAYQRIQLRNSQGVPISGLTNDLKLTHADGSSSSNTENSYAADASLKTFDNGGLDTEALVKLSNGTFWLGEEYAPSLVHVAADGTIVNRVVPAGVETQLANAGYPVSGDLPEIFAKRRLNRGIESVAVSPDNKYLYTIMQSPLSNPDADAYKASRNVRVLKMALNPDGSLQQVLAEYVYVMDIPQTFVADAARTKQNDVKISEMVALDTDDLVVLERISKHTRLYRIKLDGASNILGSNWDKIATRPSLENTSDLAAANIMPVTKSLVLDSRKLEAQKGISLPSKVEGIALLDDKFIALINDNDFGIADAKSQVVVLDVYQDLVAQSGQRIQLQELGRYDSGAGEGAAEIVAFDAVTKQVLLINAITSKVEILEVSNPSAPSRKTEIDVKADVLANGGFAAGGINSVAVSKTSPMFAVAVENADKQANGVVALYQFDQNGNPSFVSSRPVGALPDMVTFSPDGRYIVVANEGEPNDDYTNDPEGSVSIVDLGSPDAPVKNADFKAFDEATAKASLLEKGLRVFGNNSSNVAQDLEPEYITVSADSQTAYVSLQENNALAIVDLPTATIKQVVPLGFKDHRKPGNEIDASNKDDAINFANYPVLGMYQPDSIASYEYMGETYIVTANEGDARDYDGYSEEVRVKDLNLDATAYPNAAELQVDEVLGRLKTTTATGDTDGDGDIDQIYAYGGRSFSIWNSKGELVFDSGNDIGVITANLLGMNGFNADEGEFDGRSDDKGAEPEALTVGKIDDRTYAFVGLERTGGILSYDITNPMKPYFIEYVRNSKDVAPEGMAFVSHKDSPNGQPWLVVGNEVSGTVTLYQVNVVQY